MRARVVRQWLLTLLMVWLPLSEAAKIEGVRIWTAPDHTRLVFDVDGPVEHNLMTLEAPDRLVVDVKRASLATNIDAKQLSNRQIRDVRHARQDNGWYRVVLDLNRSVHPKSFLLPPHKQYGHRLVIDLYDKVERGAPRVAKSVQDLDKPRDVIVAIDAGHGGEDPGAIGVKRKTYEKNITLGIAKKLKAKVDAQPGMRAILTRTGDYYIGLRKRQEIARRHKADLFVSIHADSFPNPQARGSSVYILSERGASNEATRLLAQRENQADRAGGVKLVTGVRLDDKEKDLAVVLLDLSMSHTKEASLAAAKKVRRHLKQIGKTHGYKVMQAGFVVLKSPDIPSMLIETGFISNPQEERLLASSQHQAKIANALLAGIKGYFEVAPPPGTLLAQETAQRAKESYVIRRGDTLGAIASRYQISLNALRRANGLTGDHLEVGQILVIPET